MRPASNDGKEEGVPAPISPGQLWELHSYFSLCGETPNQLLDVPDEWLRYIVALLRGETPSSSLVPSAAWAELLPLLNQHMILPFLYDRIRSLPASAQPSQAVMGQLRSIYRRGSVESMKKQQQLLGILWAMSRDNIRVIVLKGSALSLYLYRDPALRSGIDIDLLVSPSDVISARKLLEGLGYTCLEKRIDISQAGYCEEVFAGSTPKNASIVEIHWNLSPFHSLSSQIDTAGLISRAVKIESSGFTLEVLDPIDTLIHAANHLIYNHSRSIRLNWIIDISLLCGNLKTRQDWGTLQKRSVEYGARLSLEESIRMAQYWTGLELPYGYGDFSTWPSPTAAEVEAFSMIALGQAKSLLELMIPRSAGTVEKVRLFMRLLFPSRAIMRACYPPSREWLLPLSYVKRWLRWIKRK